MDSDLATVRRCVSHLIKEFDYQQKELAGRPLKELVSVVRSVDGVIPAFLDVLFEHWRRDDCDVRLAALFIANHFFQRSHNFRLELVNSLQDFLVYTLETEPLRYPLPAPAEAARLLKKETLTMLHCWMQKFGPGYTKLEKLQHFLKNSKSIDWEGLGTDLLIDRERESRTRFAQEVKAKKMLEHITNLYGESRPEIDRIIVEAHNIIEILFPAFCSLEESTNSAALHLNGIASSIQNSDERLHGFGALNEITVCISTNGTEIEQSHDNVDLLNQLRETTNQLEKWKAKMSKWLRKLAEIGDSSAITRRIIDTRNSLNDYLQKCADFKVNKGIIHGEAGDSDEDQDFMDVEEKEGYEPQFCDHKESEEASQLHVAEGHKRTGSVVVELDQQPGPSRLTTYPNSLAAGGDVKETPKLAMGLDLKYWGQDDVKPAMRIRSHAEIHQFWRPSEECDADIVPTEDAEAYKVRQITFVGEMPPIKRRCRAPMPSGKLCPRMERERCALHGPIIDRDEQGFPMEEQKSEEIRLNKERIAQEERREEEEQEFLQDVEAATGAKLRTTVKKRKKKVSRKKKTTRTTTNKKRKGKKKGKKTARKREVPKSVKSRERLVAKLFDKQTLKRVTKTLEQMQKARSQRKFSNQFNYALERR